MSALRSYVESQQATALSLCNVLTAIDVLNHDQLAPDAVTSLIAVAKGMAESINTALDLTNLPKD